jgi:hypothetical protein
LDAVVLDSLKIAKAVRVHLNEKECGHSIKEIIREALGLRSLASDQMTVISVDQNQNGDYKDV